MAPNNIFNNKVIIPKPTRIVDKYKRRISVRIFLLRAMQEISFYCDVDGFGKAGETRAFQCARSPPHAGDQTKM